MKFLLSLALLLLPMPALACVCAGTQTVRKAYDQSCAIFAGRMIAAEYRKGIKNEFAEMDNEWRGEKREYEVLVYRFEVTRRYKGGNVSSEALLVTDEVRFDDGTSSASDCGLGFNENEEYLVYAYGDKYKIGTGVCSRTKRLSRGQADITALEMLRKGIRPPRRSATR